MANDGRLDSSTATMRLTVTPENDRPVADPQSRTTAEDTALSLVFLAYGWRLFPRWRAPLLLAVAGIIFATVYLSLHYAVDLVAGAALAAGVLAAVPQLRRLFGEDPAGLLRAKDVAAS